MTRRAGRGEVSIADPRSTKLADELFVLVQGDQGKAFISDGLDALSPRDIVEAARTSLRFTEASARKLRRFIKAHRKLL